MPKGNNQKVKILYLLKYFLENTDENNGVTLKDITAFLHEEGIDAERKAIYNDIETLELFGLDIEKRKSKDTTYHVISRQFELPELKLLIDAVQASKFISEKKSRTLIKKLSSLMSKYDAERMSRQVYVANRVKTENESIYYSIDYIHEAINSKKKISFYYFEWNEKKEKVFRHDKKRYLVSPMALTWDDENYYLIAFDGEKIKHYRVDKMSKISLTDEKRDGEEHFKDFDMALYSKKTFGMYGGREESVTIRCKNHLAGVMIDRFGEDTAFLKANDGNFDVFVKVHVSPTFLGWIMSFGDEVEIISPQSVREEISSLIEKTAKKYI